MSKNRPRTFPHPSRLGGYTLIEVLAVCAVLGVLSAVMLPSFFDMVGGVHVRASAQGMCGVLRSARLYAVRHGVKVAVKFHTEDDPMTFALYRDGDGDGVRNTDIDDGIDPVVWPRRALGAVVGGNIRFGFPPGLVPRHPGNPSRRMKKLDDPIRFNRSDLASFSPMGTATPGSIYLTDGRSQLAAVRVNNISGKVTTLSYNPTKDTWRR
jgi:prepilin-type N-terminal cleavage/methylation domain-containing protein